ncbi:MAG: UbiA family prenyltransferase [Fibrobacter sp.]|jgi:geranylgeranylglycerol-phosphate geranylgeranyltransferase|nr:UbiA family prenyltransferase [Fibrobacter sp.]
MIKKKVNIIPYIRIIRYHNALMAGLTTFLGYWLSDSSLPLSSVFLLILATICSTGFGNTINDIYDIDSDRINHPNRPLPQGAISVLSAWIFSLLLLISALVLSFSVSSLHGFATVLPLLLLTIYAFFLKATPIAGNLLVATLVAYTILYGALGSVGFPRLIFPASMAFFLNFSREIIKDLQDVKGDQASGVITSAFFSVQTLRAIIFICSTACLSLLFITIGMNLFGNLYTVIGLSVILPLHVYRTILISRKGIENKFAQISTLFKLEMLTGLVALAADKLFAGTF